MKPFIPLASTVICLLILSVVTMKKDIKRLEDTVVVLMENDLKMIDLINQTNRNIINSHR